MGHILVSTPETAPDRTVGEILGANRATGKAQAVAWLKEMAD